MLVRLPALLLVVAALLPATMAHAQAPGYDALPAAVPDDLARRLPCDEEASRVLGEWVLEQSDPQYANAVVDLLASDAAACASVRQAAISLAVVLDQSLATPGLTPAAPAMSAAVPEAFVEAEQKAERLTFSVEPPPRNLTRNLPRNRIYQP